MGGRYNKLETVAFQDVIMRIFSTVMDEYYRPVAMLHYTVDRDMSVRITII